MTLPEPPLPGHPSEAESPDLDVHAGDTATSDAEADLDGALEVDDGRALPLQRLLQLADAGSRAECKAAIAAGRVCVDGAVVRRFAEPVAAGAVVTLDGRALTDGAPPTTYLLYKPVKHVTALDDQGDLPGLRRYLPPDSPRVFCVGRLDVNTEGVLLLTNDGVLARRVLDPAVGLSKTYHVKIRDHIEPDDRGLQRIRDGLRVGRVQYRPAQARWLELRTRATWIEIVLNEGKFHEVRNMCAANRWQIVKLRRVAVGPLGLGDLTPRRIRPLSPDETAALRAAVGLEVSSPAEPG